MSDYTVVRLAETKNAFAGKYPGELRAFQEALGSQQSTFTYRRMPQGSGGRGGYAHRHATQEELYYLISGRLAMKLDNDEITLEPGTAVRVAPTVFRSVHNDEPTDAELLIISNVTPNDPIEKQEDFWPT
jgi:mannose-6-phosphate isomerase-like protein (cupin superfamily)